MPQVSVSRRCSRRTSSPGFPSWLRPMADTPPPPGARHCARHPPARAGPALTRSSVAQRPVPGLSAMFFRESRGHTAKPTPAEPAKNGHVARRRRHARRRHPLATIGLRTRPRFTDARPQFEQMDDPSSLGARQFGWPHVRLPSHPRGCHTGVRGRFSSGPGHAGLPRVRTGSHRRGREPTSLDRPSRHRIVAGPDASGQGAGGNRCAGAQRRARAPDGDAIGRDDRARTSDHRGGGGGADR